LKDKLGYPLKYSFTLFFLIRVTLQALSLPEEPGITTPFENVEVLIGVGALYGGKVYEVKTKKD
jgi:hypothetical protein